jgi:hypothetical protein
MKNPWEFVDLVARMQTEEEFGQDSPPSEDWIVTLNDLIVSARQLQKARNTESVTFEPQPYLGHGPRYNVRKGRRP